MKGIQAKLVVEPGAILKFHKCRPVPYALCRAIKQRIEKLGVPVDNSSPATSPEESPNSVTSS